MTEAQAIAFLAESQAGDPEGDHRSAEDVLMDFLRENGNEGLADAFEAYRKNWWYA